LSGLNCVLLLAHVLAPSRLGVHVQHNKCKSQADRQGPCVTSQMFCFVNVAVMHKDKQDHASPHNI
jgi:hypothetical protein